MGRKNKSKKKTAEEGAPPVTPAPLPPPPKKAPKPKKKEEGGGGTRTYLKIKAIFKCSGDNCSKKWSSVHAWERDETLFCDLCAGKADVVNFKDEMCELANYYCGTPTCRENHWQSIADGWRTENCDICGADVAPKGTQKRFGRHFWFECQSCGEGWEDFSLTPQRTQRCSKCKSRGDIIGTTKI